MPYKDPQEYARYQQNYRNKNKWNSSDYHLRRRYGITREQYDLMLSAQGGVCGICKRPPKVRRLSVDHNHKTGRIRGLLCFLCNQGIGFVRDDPGVARRMADYLDATSKT